MAQNNVSDFIYFDNNATTRVDPSVFSEMMPFFSEMYANPASSHNSGLQVKKAVEAARQQVAGLINANVDEIVFTSGATEGINFALKGLAFASQGKTHIVTSITEHSAVIDTCKYLEKIGYSVTYLNVNRNGEIDLGELVASLRPETLALCFMWVNNETGVISDVKKIYEIGRANGIYTICDATQGVGKMELDVREFADITIFSAHKMYGPKGIGAVYVSHDIGKRGKIQSIIDGGGHEHGLRSGTLNVPNIVGFGAACGIANAEMTTNERNISRLTYLLESELLRLPGVKINGAAANRLYNTVNFCKKDLDANIFIAKHSNLAVSNGSACTSQLIQPSHVLTAMGLTNEEAWSSLRVSLGKWNTDQEIKRFINCL
ncbi:cysteine desulfurase family protein [Dyadobacter sp. CY261]|uniref:cysteine desulfurase family protein n=1 Tax=Dyadobacter sp. CY261 TaxID=2907203 RepID=UPI001F40DF0B|nr:cysteine desulfurase family protein [Dyadobacter sp. CY261]